MIVTEKTLRRIDEETLDRFRRQIRADKTLRYSLPEWGWIYLEGQLPFTFLYRPSVEERTWGSESFVLTEASCVAADPSLPRLDELLGALVESSLAPDDETFLILEIRNGALLDLEKTYRPDPRPELRVEWDPADDRAAPLAGEIEHASEQVVLFGHPANTVLAPSGEVGSLRAIDSRIIHLGLELSPVHVNPETGAPFPVVLQRYRREISDLLRRIVFIFERDLTRHNPPSYRALGRHEVLLTDWRVDRQLTQIADSFSFLLSITPVNQDQAWEEFESSGFREMPHFHYRRLTIDPEAMKGELYRIPVEEVEDPILSYLFREKRAEIARMLTMLEERETHRFIYNSLQLYGEVEDELFALATEMLRDIPPPDTRSADHDRVDAEEFAHLAKEELDYYLAQVEGVETHVEILPEITSLMVSNGVLCVPASLDLPTNRVEGLINHEVGTHIVTWINGKTQKLEQLYTGLAGYDELQEGLAVLAEYFVGQLSDARLRLLAGRVVAARRLTEHRNFVQAFDELVQHGFTEKQAFGICVRVWRGGGLTKDAIYLRGLANLLRWISSGGDLDLLYLGKITESHVPLMEELIEREILHPPPVRPRYLSDPATSSKLEQLSSGCSVLDLRRQS